MKRIGKSLLVVLAACAVSGVAHADSADCADNAFGRVILYSAENYGGDSIALCVPDPSAIGKGSFVELGDLVFDGHHAKVAGHVRSWKVEPNLPNYYGVTFAGGNYYTSQQRKFYSCTSKVFDQPGSFQSQADGCTKIAVVVQLVPSKQSK